MNVMARGVVAPVPPQIMKQKDKQLQPDQWIQQMAGGQINPPPVQFSIENEMV